MLTESPWLLPAVGLLIGIITGAVARWNHFCTLSALERHWYADDSRGLRTWVLAAAVALLSTQALIASGNINIDQSFYLRPHFALTGYVIGGIMFGIGMALVGTCGFGALVRLGGGSIRSLIVVVAIGLAALTAQKGLIGSLRVSVLEPLSIELSSSQSIASIIERISGFSSPFSIAVIMAVALLYWIFSSAEFRADKRSIFTGSIIGLCVTAGWIATSFLSTVMFRQVQIESASYVLPPGEVLFSLIAVTGSIPDYGVGLVVGVVIGSAIAANLTNDVRWEACDDARELGRHLSGAFLMGTGGVMAAGCTIGQGVSAMSTMALSAPIAFISICIGARIGLKMLIEGTSSLFSRSA